MKAPISVETSSSSPVCDILPSYWRGDCLNFFAIGEAIVSDCLETIRAAGIELTSESSHPGHLARQRSLVKALEDNAFGGHSKVALARLHDWGQLYEHRPWLAHGLLSFANGATSFTMTAYTKGGRTKLDDKHYQVVEMREFLRRLAAVSARLASQLNQIKAHCSRLSPNSDTARPADRRTAA